MKSIDAELADLGMKIPDILLPREDVDMTRWSVVACDQYTSEPDYWKSLEEEVSESPSTLKLILPECYLESPDKAQRISQINRTMESYLSDGVLNETGTSLILVERKTPDSPSRWGLVAALDLEKYDYSKDSTSLIRATEGTILERIPPRKQIRQNAAIELPHIMVLIDDPDKTVIEPLQSRLESFQCLYDFELMKNGGHIRGFRLSEESDILSIVRSMKKLADPDRFKSLYGADDLILFAMGDGNHSLATAKAIWEDLKQRNRDNQEIMNHPSRWALVEIENIYDKGLLFEPIHRVVFNSSFADFQKYLGKYGKTEFKAFDSVPALFEHVSSSPEFQILGYVDSDRTGVFEIDSPAATISAGTAQYAIDSLIHDTHATVDYIHGIDTTERIGRQKGNFGVFLPALDKSDFFRTVAKDGSLPRKTFSMGHAHEKRYYLEARKIR